ncbi:MAG: benzoate/H(+) symporter BenE family transporter [Achromobacter sp.]|jgi:benzoate membrane transport protein|uniref:Inner membrane protein YdcO n=2 Tax=Pseudomonadati TaxID=3379134 RepID=A0A6J4ZJI9_9BURK|nr:MULTISPECIES: benzoate/H(+) symporter BenE family transporter [Achromobacter]MBN9639146.1 benzoate/H(+) symporter BenE family transporter [Achromobacter sp.]MCG2596216.1 benzoate/H(+) symporter BenE family transporter [Achromobacter sp.]MCG2603035.1 benzoate/H(+) symporter BenE family transporter [Achromobacter sp.]CAB3632729.1 Inner membrane protein YdcO [Achromobacter insuavis]CAB3831883.1 Inner membrane protein YdcO [Achromobacter insuavis]
MSDTAQPGFDTPSSRPNARRDLSASAIAAGLVAVLVSFGGTAVLMVQAGHAAGLDAARIGSWIGSLSLVLGLGGAAYSLRTGLPIVMAWSTPGAALLVTALAGVPFPEAIGAFVLAAALTLACGLFGWIDPILRRIPGEVAAAMLAGVLLNFGMGIFTNVGKQPALVLAMCAAYLVCRRWAPRYAVLMVMAVAVAMAAGLGLVQVDQLDWHLTEFVWTTPVFSMQAAVSLGVPLFVVAMASQNLPGLAILQAAGYRPPASRLVAATGFLGLLAAPFGAHSVTLGAISAAICTGPEAHAEPSKRYIAAATYGVSYFALSIVAGAVAVFFQALPAALLAALAGLALLGTIMGGMAAAMANPQRREAALITLLATASGFSFWGIGSAFWGLVAGLLAHTVFEFKRKQAA